MRAVRTYFALVFKICLIKKSLSRLLFIVTCKSDTTVAGEVSDVAKWITCCCKTPVSILLNSIKIYVASDGGNCLA